MDGAHGRLRWAEDCAQIGLGFLILCALDAQAPNKLLDQTERLRT